MLLVVAANLHRRSIKEGVITWVVHWKLARKYNFEAGDKWYEHEPESALENEIIKSLGISVLRLIILWKLGDQIWL